MVTLPMVNVLVLAAIEFSITAQHRFILAMTVGILVALGLLVGVICLHYYNLRCLQENKTSIFTAPSGFAALLKYLTVCLLIDAIMILGILGELEGQTLGTLIGGIAGYVLGNVTGRFPNENNDGNGQPGVSNTSGTS